MRKSVVLGAGGAALLGAAGVGAGVALSDHDRRVRLERQARVWRLSARRSLHWAVVQVRGSRAREARRGWARASPSLTTTGGSGSSARPGCGGCRPAAACTGRW